MNQKGYCTLFLHGLMDHRGQFMNTNVGHTGKVLGRVFKRSGLYHGSGMGRADFISQKQRGYVQCFCADIYFEGPQILTTNVAHETVP